MSAPLAGRTVALAETRQLAELAQMLEKEGATTLRCPLLGIVDNPDQARVITWLHDLVGNRFDWVVLMTGEALRRLLGFAERAASSSSSLPLAGGGVRAFREAVIAALGRTRTLTRGPKPVRALKEVGLMPTKVADVPTTEGVIAALGQETLAGMTAGVTLYGEPNPALVGFLENSGAKVHTVLPYVYAPASDAAHVANLIEKMSRGEVDVIVFTSSPQLDRLYEVATQSGLEAVLQEGWKRTRIAAVGPVVAERLRQRTGRVDICPAQGFVMKNLVQHIRRELGTKSGVDGRQ
jgi:uroporphyrinogen-III synthase